MESGRSHAERVPDERDTVQKKAASPLAALGKVVVDLDAVAGREVERHLVAVVDLDPEPPVKTRRHVVGQLVLPAEDAFEDVLALSVRPQRVPTSLVSRPLEP